MVNEKVLPLFCGVVAFLIMKKPAPGVTTQSNGLLFGEPDGNEHTLMRFGDALAEIVVSGIEHDASTSAPSSPAEKKVSPGSFSTSHTMPVGCKDLMDDAQRS